MAVCERQLILHFFREYGNYWDWNVCTTHDSSHIMARHLIAFVPETLHAHLFICVSNATCATGATKVDLVTRHTFENRLCSHINTGSVAPHTAERR
jgi:hypothetical protein